MPETKLKLRPGPNDIVIHAAVEADILPASEVITGEQLEKHWPAIVQATHPRGGMPFSHAYFKDKRIQPPFNLDRFLAVCCRAVSSFEHHGPNINGDGFPSEELQRFHHTLVFKGFYIEHKSWDPANAKGMNIHSEFFPWDEPRKDGDYVRTISLIDKFMFPREADMIREGLESKRGGVSIGCIAGSAQCSRCGNIARRKDEICECMNRQSLRCIKGKKGIGGEFLGWDLCRDLGFYELTFTGNRADRDALQHWVQGADLSAAAKEVTKGRDSFAPPAVDQRPDVPAVGQPPEVKEPKIMSLDPETLKRVVHKDANAMFRQRLHKFVKDLIDRNMSPLMKEKMLDIKPEIKELVEEKKGLIELVV